MNSRWISAFRHISALFSHFLKFSWDLAISWISGKFQSFSMVVMPRKTETRATKSQSTKRMWPNANIPPKNTNDRPNRTTNHDGSNSNWETPSIARRRSLASATKRLATIKWYQMGITNVQGCLRENSIWTWSTIPIECVEHWTWRRATGTAKHAPLQGCVRLTTSH